MSNLVDPSKIESIVGVARHATDHYGRAVSAENTVYVLHSQACKDSGIDLRDCEYSQALDNGIDTVTAWADREDTLVPLQIKNQRLVPREEEN